MGITVATTRVAADIDTAPYTQDITTADLGGLTPGAAILIVTYGITDGVQADHYGVGVGAVAGAPNECAAFFSDENGSATTVVRQVTSSSKCVKVLQPGSSTVDGEAEFSSWITNGIRINWTNAPSAAWLVEVLFFAGTDLSAHADNEDLGDSTDNAVDITAPTFEPDWVFAFCAGGASIDDAATATKKPSWGFVHNGDSTVQGCHAYHQSQGSSAGSPDGRATATYGIMEIASDATLDWGLEFGGWDANGFTVTTRNAGANDTALLYLALNFGGAIDVWVGGVDTPTSTGNDPQTDPGFTPQAVFSLCSLMEALDTEYNSSPLAGAMGFSVFDADDEFCSSVVSEDGAGTTDTKSVSEATAVEVPQDDGTAGLTAAFTAFTATGWNWNFNPTLGTAKKFWTAAFEEMSDRRIFITQA